MSKTLVRMLAVLLALGLVAAACGGDDSAGGDDGGDDGGEPAEELDYEAIGLWDDGPCDEAKEPLHIGLQTVFESAFLSLEDQALALEAAATAFNERGGANGSCIEVTTCDDGGTLDQAVECVRTLKDAGVVATVNDQGTAGQLEVSEAMQEAGIPRVAGNVIFDDWADPNAYPLDASGTGVTFLMPLTLIENDILEIGQVRVDNAGAGRLVGFLEGLYGDDGATFPYDAPVPAGTTDFTQFILGAQEAGVGGITLALGENEALQVVDAGQQLNTELMIGASLGTFSHAAVSEMGDFAGNLSFAWSFLPSTADLPAYDALRADLAASGEEGLQPENLKASPMRSWIGLYALLKVLRDAEVTEFTGETITTALQAAEDVPMLDMFGGEDWTPALEHPGAFKKAGMNHWAIWNWDPEAESVIGKGDWVQKTELNFDEVLCGSPLGAPC